MIRTVVVCPSASRCAARRCGDLESFLRSAQWRSLTSHTKPPLTPCVLRVAGVRSGRREIEPPPSPLPLSGTARCGGSMRRGSDIFRLVAERTAHQPARPRCSALPPVGSARFVALLGVARRGSARLGTARREAKRSARCGVGQRGVSARLSVGAARIAAWRGAA